MKGQLNINSVPTDQSRLIERVQQGDEAAFYAFYKMHARYIAGVAYRLLAENQEVDDVVQETFITAAQKVHQLKAPEHARPWLVKIAVRHAHKHLARRRRAEKRQQADELEVPGKTDMRLASLVDDLRDALLRIPRKMVEPWILHRLEGMTIEEAATACNISAATVIPYRLG